MKSSPAAQNNNSISVSSSDDVSAEVTAFGCMYVLHVFVCNKPLSASRFTCNGILWLSWVPNS